MIDTAIYVPNPGSPLQTAVPLLQMSRGTYVLQAPQQILTGLAT